MPFPSPYPVLSNGPPERQRDWMARQAYVSPGFLLLGAASMGLDATPIEGFYANKMTAAPGLEEQHLTSVVIAALVYREEGDFNAKVPKSRFAQSQDITRL